MNSFPDRPYDNIGAYCDDYLQQLARAGASIDHDKLTKAAELLNHAFEAGAWLFVCGNGGSAADAMHIAGELVGRYKRERRGYNAIALGVDVAVTTAWSNDYSFESIFERQVEALGAPGGVVWGLSTSGNSENVVRALIKAKDGGMQTLAMTGEGGGRLAGIADILVAVPSSDTPRIQEVHTALYHYVCETVERRLTE